MEKQLQIWMLYSIKIVNGKQSLERQNPVKTVNLQFNTDFIREAHINYLRLLILLEKNMKKCRKLP